jgi:AcrB/AcrD/AcrF family
MTSFAFILGVLPLVIAKGAGAEMNQALGTAVFAGMIGVFWDLFHSSFFLCYHEDFYPTVQKEATRLDRAAD